MRFCLVLVLFACSGGGHQIAIPGVPPRMTQGMVSGPLCEGETCKCRDLSAAGDGGAGVPSDNHKRFEIRLSSAQELWARVRDTQLYKSAEKPEVCFYIDLPSGDTPIELRASNKDGVSAEWKIRELGVKTKSWYDTFGFECGNPGVCSVEELDAMHAKYNAYKHGVEDMCGSVKIKGLTWDTGKVPDGLHPSELLVRLVLDVYKRNPTQAHGDETCGKGPPPPELPDVPPDPAPAAQ